MRPHFLRLAILPALVMPLLLSLQWGHAVALPSAPAAVSRLRIGIYRLNPSDLAQAGVDPADADPRTFLIDTMTLFGDSTLRLSLTDFPVYFPLLSECTGSCQTGVSQ